MKCELQVIRETWRVRTDFERIAGCFRYVNDQTTDRAGFLVHKILFLVLNSRIYCGRSPHGERGLKYHRRAGRVRRGRSLPTRGAWIEMSAATAVYMLVWSLPTRGAWIEIELFPINRAELLVAPHTGSVD